MRVACVGGGPAGLLLSVLLARLDGFAVDVFERQPADVTYGFGVVFSRLSTARLRMRAREVIDEILAQGVRWESIEVRGRGAPLRSSGHGFGAVDRRRLLQVLQGHARAAGARLHFSTPVEAPDLLDDYDLVVAADGAGSGTRRHYAAQFRPEIRRGSSRYIWLAMDRAVDAMQFLFVEGPHGPMAAHVYPYSDRSSTFLVEVPEEVWLRTGFTDAVPHPGWNDDHAVAYCQQAFATELAGARLTGSGSRWQLFVEVRNERWFSGPVVLLGDAAHTAHFSVGSGTSLAMDDAAELARCLGLGGSLEEALGTYQSNRQSAVRGIQEAAWTSSQFWEQLGHEDGRHAGALMLRLLTRTGQTDLDTLLRIDPGLAELVPPMPRALDTDPPRAIRWAGQDGRPSACDVAIFRPEELPLDETTRLAGWAGFAVSLPEKTRPHPAEYATRFDALRRSAPDVPCGLLVPVDGEPDQESAFESIRRQLLALTGRIQMDFVAFARRSMSPSARSLQMVLCDFVKSGLGLTAVYACTAANLGHARTHVRAERADRVWLLQE